MTAEELVHHTFPWEIAPGVAGDAASPTPEAAEGAAAIVGGGRPHRR